MREKASSFVRFEEILGEQIQTFLLALNESCLLHKLKSYLSVALYLIPFTFTAAQLVNQLILISRFERDITSVIPKPE